MKSRHTYINKLKRLDSLDDFRKILVKNYSSAWKTAKPSDIDDCFGLPKQYPCFMQVDTEIDHEPDWGNGINKMYHFYYI